MFIEICKEYLANIATDSDRVPTLYFSKYKPVRKFFWMRLRLIYYLFNKERHLKNTCLDFGGGGGVFLPTLSKSFNSVFCIDLENHEAKQVIEKFKINNVTLIQADISKVNLQASPFDVIVAADVLEHFKDLSLPVEALKKWLSPKSILYVSLPSENFLYVFLRKVFNIQKPWDHYHTGKEVEKYLKNSGFKKIKSLFVPFYLPIFPLFYISSWKFDEKGNHEDVKI